MAVKVFSPVFSSLSLADFCCSTEWQCAESMLLTVFEPWPSSSSESSLQGLAHINYPKCSLFSWDQLGTSVAAHAGGKSELC